MKAALLCQEPVWLGAGLLTYVRPSRPREPVRLVQGVFGPILGTGKALVDSPVPDLVSLALWLLALSQGGLRVSPFRGLL